MVFEFLKKRFQGVASDAHATEERSRVPSPGGYEARRAAAEALHAKGATAEAVALLESLASDLAGDGSFPLAVAVRHQISAWTAGPSPALIAAEAGAAMARKREESAATRPARGTRAAPAIPEGIAKSRFFADMSSREIAGFIASTGRRTFRQGEIVLEQGKPGRSLFIVTRGVLRVETTGATGGTLRMGVLTTGDAFGEVAFLTGRPRTATVVAETAAECLEIGTEAWTKILGDFPRVRKVLEEVHRERARLTADAVLEDVRRHREAGGA